MGEQDLPDDLVSDSDAAGGFEPVGRLAGLE